MYTYSQSYRGMLFYEDPAAFSDVLRELERDKERRFKDLVKLAKRWPLTHEVVQLDHDMTASKAVWEHWIEALGRLAARAHDGYLTAGVAWDDESELRVFDAGRERSLEAAEAGKPLRFFPLHVGCVWRFSARGEGVVRDVDWRVTEADGVCHLTSHCGTMPVELRALTPQGSKLYHRWGDVDRLILDEEAEPGSVWFHCEPADETMWVFLHDGFEAIHAPYVDLPCALTWRIERHHVRRSWPAGERLDGSKLSRLSRTRIALGDRLGPVLVRGKMKMDLARIDPGPGQVLPPPPEPVIDERPWWKIW